MTADDFCRSLEKDCGIAPGDHVLAAVSGGADSVAMLCLLGEAQRRMGLSVSVAHVEHGIRGEQSLGDQAFVRDLCEQMNLPFYTASVDAPEEARRLSCGLEDAARRLRYAFLERTREEIGADVIATAHHRGDQAETVLLHAARGSDLRGLGAMRARRERIIRPLLSASAQELRAYLNAIGQDWREDATNADMDYARNRIRHRVLPELERACPGAEKALSRLSRAAQRDEDFFARQLAALDIRLIPLADGAAVELAQIRSLHEALLSRIIVRLMEAAGAEACGHGIDALIRAVKREGAASVGVGSLDGEAVQARVGQRYLCVSRPYKAIADTPLRIDAQTQTPLGTFLVRKAQPGETGDGIASQLVPERLLEGAVVSVRREGDAMIPFGQHTPVKLKKLLMDSGVERAMRRSVPVVRSREGILWLPGIRPSEACRTDEKEERRMIVFRRAECVKIQ